MNLKHATTKHAITIGVLQRAHATIKTSLKMASGENRKQWHKYLPFAILNYNTTYHSSSDCEPSEVIHGRVPHNFPDHKLDLQFNLNTAPTTDFAEPKSYMAKPRKMSCSLTSNKRRITTKK